MMMIMMMMIMMMMMMISKFKRHINTKRVISPKTGVNCPMRLNSLITALCESFCYQAKSEQNVRQDLIPRVRHGEAGLMNPEDKVKVTTSKL